MWKYVVADLCFVPLNSSECHNMQASLLVLLLKKQLAKIKY